MSDNMSDVTEWVYSDNIKAIHTGNDHESFHDTGFRDTNCFTICSCYNHYPRNKPHDNDCHRYRNTCSKVRSY
jgi:hypothetical protein